MRGLVFLFLSVVIAGVGFRYCSPDSRKWAIKVVKENLLVFIVAIFLVAAAIFFSINSTVRLV